MARGRSSEDFERGERDLRELPEVELLGLLRRSSNYTFLARLTGAGDELLAVYKPAGGESPLWDFPDGTLYLREVAAYRLARFLGWPVVPPTIVRESAPHGVGAMQLFVDAQADRHYLNPGRLPTQRWLEVAVFDVLVNNADRKSGHCLVDDSEELWVIDHGLTFHTEPKLRTVIWDFSGQRVPRQLREDLARAARSLEGGELEEALGDLLARSEVAMLRRRLRAMLSPGWQLPTPSSAWSVPWPPV
jgi:hypothetical protein